MLIPWQDGSFRSMYQWPQKEIRVMKRRKGSCVRNGLSTAKAKRRGWNRRFDAAVKQSHVLFKEWLRKRGIRPDKVDEADLERIVRNRGRD